MKGNLFSNKTEKTRPKKKKIIVREGSLDLFNGSFVWYWNHLNRYSCECIRTLIIRGPLMGQKGRISLEIHPSVTESWLVCLKRSTYNNRVSHLKRMWTFFLTLIHCHSKNERTTTIGRQGYVSVSRKNQLPDSNTLWTGDHDTGIQSSVC